MRSSTCPSVRHAPKVALINHISEIGGAELSLLGLARAMPSEWCQYHVVLSQPGPLADRVAVTGVPLSFVRMECWRAWITSIGDSARLCLTIPLQVFSLWRWWRFLRRGQFDIVHVNTNCVITPVLAARLAGVPCLMHFRSIPSRLQSRFGFGSRVYYWFMNQASIWVANSTATARDISPHTRKPVEVIPNGIDLVEFDQRTGSGASCAGQQPKGFRVAMVASLQRWKNHPDFLRVAAATVTRRRDITFVIAGTGDQAYRADLLAMARALGVERQIEMAGFVENIPAFLRGIDVLLHTTDAEPFGRVFIEAMAASRPVVAVRSGGAEEVVVDGETGFLTAAHDTAAQAEAVVRLLEDAELRRRLGERGRLRVEQHYNINRHCEAVAAVYNSMLALA
jgi:glycosyltransferase involved in cell wall biosynthesis